MIKKLLILFAAAGTLSACDMFKKDNYEAPNAQLHGRILDKATGDLVETDIHEGSIYRWQELGDEWTTGWNERVIMQSGEYRDNQMFSGRYKFEFLNANFFPFSKDEVVIGKGDNEIDWEVTPYIRVKNVQIAKDDAAKVIRATFSLEAGDPQVRLNKVRLYCSTDIYVGEPFTTFNTGGEGFQIGFTDDPETEVDETVIDPAKVYTLTIDLTNDYNKDYFKFSRNYFFRVGAKAANIAGMGTVRSNYAPYTVINFSTAQ
ncbi:MAG: DUF3823 domain-containing protein [Alistipes sp.]|jgi:hypothetical protein|nr:DUF3823 domain-containing protein [Alistipes sp.]